MSNIGAQARECLRFAEHCASMAEMQSDPQLRKDFLEMQRRWLSLAYSYEFSERLNAQQMEFNCRPSSKAN